MPSVTRVGVCLLAAMALLANSASRVDARLHNVREFRGHNSHFHLSPDGNDDPTVANIKEEYFEDAIVDHFAPLSERKSWKQRYFINDEYWAGSDYPVFLSVGGEGPIGARGLSNHSFINYLAQKHRALLVALEHRFYGKSYPTKDMSLPNMRYLSSEQALADAVRFHSFITDKYGLKHSKWVAFGGSYPGSLSAWLKLKYPALFAGNVASSAPILAKSNFFEYMEVVGDGLRYFGGGECYRAVEESIVQLRKLMDSVPEGRDKVTNLFKPCYPMKCEFDDSVFESSIMGAFQDIAQYNKIRAGQMTLSDVCAHFTGGGDPVELLAQFIAKTNTKDCLDSKFEGEKNATVDILREDTFDGESSMRQWFYQTCNEFGYFQTTTSRQTPFWALRTLNEKNVGLEICKRVFNIAVKPDIKSTNIEYGALDITVENVTFPSGTIDPWHVLAPQNTTELRSDLLQPIFIEGTAHCADMYHPDENDTAEMVWAHERIARNVAFYLGHESTPFEKAEAPANSGSDYAAEDIAVQ